MRRCIGLIAIYTLLVNLSTGFAAAADETPVPETTPVSPTSVSSDQIQREQLRLTELGYLLTPISAIADDAYIAARSAFLAENGLTDDDDAIRIAAVLFAAEAIPAPYTVTAVSLGRSLHDTPFATGLALTWNDVSQRLTTGETYQLTSATSGILFRMRYLESSGHAELTPELSWDDATLYSLLHTENGSRKMPVVVHVGALRIAASIQLNTILPDASGGMHRYCLYFTDSISDFTGIVDAEHAYLIRYATEENTADMENLVQPDAASDLDTVHEPSVSPSIDQTPPPDDADIPIDDMPADDSD